MKKVATVVAKQRRTFSQPRLIIGWKHGDSDILGGKKNLVRGNEKLS
jgi:hypothetical protein